MTTKDQPTPAAKSTISAVRKALSNQIESARIATEATELTAAAALWNAAVKHRPALMVRCERTVEVQHAVRTAREFGMPLSVRGGGHDPAGRAIRTGGLVIDLSGMRGVSVHDGIVTVAGGANSEDVAAAADRFGFAVATGTVGAVGMVGLTLGGGYGPFCGRFGLAADNILGAEVVLPDGQIVRAGRDGDPDLLWALQGGGGNFGVVTSVDVASHPLAEILVGSFTFPFEDAESLLTGYGELISNAADDLTAILSIAPSGDGSPVIAVSPTWCGPIADGYAVMDEFAELATPLATDVSVMSPLSKLRQLDGMFPDGAHYAVRTRNIAALTPAAASTMLDAYTARREIGSFLNVHHFHGRATRRTVGSTAFGRRDDHLMVEMIETGESVSGWTRYASTTLAPLALPGGYPNLLDPDDEEQTAAAYGPNVPRLLDIKDRFDPDGVFRATTLPDRPDAGETAR